MTKIEGLYTALITPFNEAGAFDEEGFRNLLRMQIAAGVDGIMVLGTTGESPTLTRSEKERAVVIAREETRGKVAFMVGAGSYSTQQTIENVRWSEEYGAESVLIVTPYYNRPTQEGIFLHFKAVSEAARVPVIVYNHQGRTGQNISTETLLRIAKLPNICGVKDSSGQLQQMMDVIDQIKRGNPDFCVMSGVDLLTMPNMAMGGDGVISVVSNMVPVQMKQLTAAMQRRDLDHARHLHYALLPIFNASEVETNPIPIKATMSALGLPAGTPRLPLCNLTSQNEKKLHHTLADPKVKQLLDVNCALYRQCAEPAMTR